MADEQMTVAAVLLVLAKADEVTRVQLKLWISVERFSMMDLDLLGPQADEALRMLLEVGAADRRPLT